MRHLTLRALVFVFAGDDYKGEVPGWTRACDLAHRDSLSDEWASRGYAEALLMQEAWPDGPDKGKHYEELMPTCPECATLWDVAMTERKRLQAVSRRWLHIRMLCAGINTKAPGLNV